MPLTNQPFKACNVSLRGLLLRQSRTNALRAGDEPGGSSGEKNTSYGAWSISKVGESERDTMILNICGGGRSSEELAQSYDIVLWQTFPEGVRFDLDPSYPCHPRRRRDCILDIGHEA